MEMRLPDDFKEFLKLLNENKVEYLIVGGVAVAFHGYPRTTGDLDIWVAMNPQNANRLAKVCREFGFNVPELSPNLFLEPDNIIRMGILPIRIDILSTITGLDFSECYPHRVVKEYDDIYVNVIDIPNLLKNKKLIRRNKDLDDIENLS
jgi:hypothetical protein